MNVERDDEFASEDAARLFACIGVAAEMVEDLVGERTTSTQRQRVFALTSVIAAASRWGHLVCGKSPDLMGNNSPADCTQDRRD